MVRLARLARRVISTTRVGRRPAPKGKAKPERAAPKGPIRERNSGRMLDIDDSDDAGMPHTEIDDFDDFATSKESDGGDDEE